ncbi:alpha/beta fold hydrolase [Lentibacter sp. XHP0401]|jgi:pimeloyl-ACP methyl ester carboxylesterase|uniref:alpha/beta fold hydrolase n=1 Tax=Lentibacter sp. XHP0401 TaxID=2984334 RepID=UPI0021E84421|nr:alpha/beta hydrolase [Lentibacter sp. XHP0401]MCV2894767.1 alpha/beta hydrolase [Lentibacter sp. XHP0401]
MSTPRHSFVSVLDHELHVTCWGDPAAKPLVMWHGLARTGRDFDELARALSDTHFVLCPDTIGRGLSSWSSNPKAEYSIEYYTGIAVDMLDHFAIDKAGWLGTSMGGLIGMRMASSPLAARLNYLIINDTGPEVPQEAIERILTYAGNLPEFDRVEEAAAWLHTVYDPFGPAPESFWERMVRSSLRRRSDGRFTLHYDPRIIQQFEYSAAELTSWDRYRRITLPTHVLAGAKSDILTPDILARMKEQGPKPAVTLFESCGHAPALANPEDAALLRHVIAELSAAS